MNTIILFTTGIEIPAAVQLPIWVLVVLALLRALKSYTPLLDSVFGKGKCEENIKILRLKVEALEQKREEDKKEYQAIKKEYELIKNQHELLLTRIDVLMKVDPDNELMGHVIPQSKKSKG